MSSGCRFMVHDDESFIVVVWYSAGGIRPPALHCMVLFGVVVSCICVVLCCIVLCCIVLY